MNMNIDEIISSYGLRYRKVYNDNIASALSIAISIPKEFGELVLVGSRRFGSDITQSTDYDFYIDYSPKICNWLEDKGFKPTIRADYLDTSCVLVYEKDNVDIQLRNNISYYEAACSVMDQLGYCFYDNFKKLPKNVKTNFWNVLMSQVII